MRMVSLVDGLAVSSLALGTMTFGKEADEATSHAMLDHYVASGGNFIDTADRYSMGGSEEIISRWLASSGKRDEVVIATKARFPMPRGSGLHPDYLRGAIEDNLSRLGIETLDLFQPHAFDPSVHPSEWLGLVADLIAEGKLRYVGVSNFLDYQLQQTVDAARYEGLPMVVSLQAQYSLVDRHIDYEVMAVCRQYDIPILAWSPLGGGWLTGKYHKDQKPTGSTRLGEDPTRGMEAYEKRNTEHTYQVLDVLAEVSQSVGMPMTQVALAWLLQTPEVESVILGARSVGQLEQNLAAHEVRLSDEQWEQLRDVSSPYLPHYPYGFLDTMGGR